MNSESYYRFFSESVKEILNEIDRGLRTCCNCIPLGQCGLCSVTLRSDFRRESEPSIIEV